MTVRQSRFEGFSCDWTETGSLAEEPELHRLLADRAEEVQLPCRRLLARARETPRHAHLLLSGVASLVTVLQDGRGIQSGLIGPGSLVEAYHLMGADQVFTEAVMQVNGMALRVPFADLRTVVAKSDRLQRLLLSQVSNYGLVANQLVACNYYHALEQRLASLLLLLHEHAQSSHFYLTQEFLANMLGVRRTTLTLVASKLQQMGMIRYSRGRVEICAKENLEQLACECFGVIRTINRHCRPR
jgi:CRP-like cAMP-binding protein